MMNGYANDAAQPLRMAPWRPSPHTSSRHEWMGAVGHGVNHPPINEPALSREDAGLPCGSLCLRCPHYQGAHRVNLAGAHGDDKGNRNGSEMAGSRPSARGPDSQKNRPEPISDAKVLVRYARIKAVHHAMSFLRLTRGERLVNYVIIALVCTWAFNLALDQMQ